MPDVGTPRPKAPLDAPHVSTSEWQSFEGRMRRRRAERCLLRAEEALAAGDESRAAAALAEAQELSPSDTPDLETLRFRLQSAAAAAAATAADLAVEPADFAVIPADLALRPADFAATPADFAVTPAAERGRPWIRTVAAAVVVIGLILAGLALSIRIDRVPDVPASAAVQDLVIPPRASTEPPAVPPDAAPPAAVVSRPDAVAQAAAPLVPSGPRVPEAELRRAVYTPPPPTVGTTGSETLPAVLGASPSVAVAAPEPPPVVPPEIPAVPLDSASAPAAPVAVTEPPPPPAPPPVEPRIRAVLSSYEAGFRALDASAVHRVWPGVDERSLARAFDGLASQSVSLGDCAITVRGDTAAAQCQGSTTWAPKVGGGSRTEARQWEFALRNAGASWVIVRADVR